MRVNEIPRMIVYYLLLTIFVEVIIAIIIGVRDKKDILNIILVNIATNPLLNALLYFLAFSYGPKIKVISIIILEFLVFVFEGLIYYKFLNNKKINAFLLSFVLNGCSFLTGEIINGFLEF